MGESAHMTVQERTKKPNKIKGKGKAPFQAGFKKESKCFFYKKKGHMKKSCAKFKAWLEKKGNSTLLLCYEFNMVDISSNT